ncbi:hypothetical protein HZA38_02110 [Candidatus Peregrinibacteria bacterium]|nr:hypothetical protein [Candidatus Peregrinibacteria bacterium]
MNEILGGFLYFLSKVFLSYVGESDKKKIRIGWIVYLLGVPSWVIILWHYQSYIFCGTELAGGIVIFRGLISSFQEKKKTEFDSIDIGICVLVFLITLWHTVQTVGFESIVPYLEVIIAVGFPLGGYLRRKENIFCWYAFTAMHLAAMPILWEKGRMLLWTLQALSVFFALRGVKNMAEANE